MRLSRIHLALLGLLAAALPAGAVSRISSDEAKNPHAATTAAHLHVELLVPGSSLGKGTRSNTAGLYFKLEPGWHIYWKNAGDSGEPPHVKWTLPEGITASPLQFPAPTRLPLGPLMDFGYENEVVFPFSFNVAKTAKPGPADLHAKVDWLVCREVCIPGKAELDLTKNVADRSANSLAADPDAALIKRFTTQLPKSSPRGFTAVFQPAGSGFHLAVTTGQRETTAEFFPADQNVLDNPAPQKLTPTTKGLILDLKKDANLTTNPGQLSGVLELSGGRAFDLVAVPGVVAGGGDISSASTAPSTAAAPAQSSAAVAGQQSGQQQVAPRVPVSSASELLKASGLAFLGGLLLNLMPCVFPVLFIKGLALVRSSNEERHVLRAHGFIYAAGILVSFWALVAALLVLRTAGAHLGWGYQFQSPIFLALMASLLFFLGLSLAGQFEIGLTLTSAGGSLAAKQGYAGSFFTGVLAVVVATPCTAPLMGAAIGYALQQSPAVTFAVFTALALGLAAPYVALTLQPAWTRFLPRPGVWMDLSEAGNRCPHLCHRDLAGVGAGAGLRRRYSCRSAGEPVACRDCRLVFGSLACATVGNCCCKRRFAWRCRGKRVRSCEASRYAFGLFYHCDAGWVGAVDCRDGESLSIARPPGFCGLYGELVPELPGQRARCSQSARSAEGFCGCERGPAARGLDAARRCNRAGARGAWPQWRSGVCPVHSGGSEPSAFAGGADARHCDRSSRKSAALRNPVGRGNVQLEVSRV